MNGQHSIMLWQNRQAVGNNRGQQNRQAADQTADIDEKPLKFSFANTRIIIYNRRYIAFQGNLF